MIQPVTTDITKGWPYRAHRGYSPDLVQLYCVQDPNWQAIRKSMKGLLTVDKLRILEHWRTNHSAYDGLAAEGVLDERTQCQIDNYLGALRRGGQLDMNNLIQKVR